jgi:AcrR family transcriptional regulator
MPAKPEKRSAPRRNTTPLAEAAVADSPNTRERLKEVAIELFAKHGLEAVSVRDITGTANLKNAGSLNYYFRTKDELIRQITIEIMAAADAYWKTGIDRLLERSDSPSIRDLVRVLVSWPASPERGGKVPSTGRFLAMFVHGRRELLRDLMRQAGLTQYDRALSLVRKRMTKVSDAVARQRIVFFFWSSTAFLGAHEAALDSRESGSGLWRATDVIESFTDAMVGMLTAPSRSSG